MVGYFCFLLHKQTNGSFFCDTLTNDDSDVALSTNLGTRASNKHSVTDNSEQRYWVRNEDTFAFFIYTQY